MEEDNIGCGCFTILLFCVIVFGLFNLCKNDPEEMEYVHEVRYGSTVENCTDEIKPKKKIRLDANSIPETLLLRIDKFHTWGMSFNVSSDSTTFSFVLNGIATPRLGQSFYEQVEKDIQNFISGKCVRFVFCLSDSNDSHIPAGNAYFEDGSDIGLELLKKGLAWYYNANCDNSVYSEAERVAREKRIGLWSEDNPVEPWIFNSKNR